MLGVNSQKGSVDRLSSCHHDGQMVSFVFQFLCLMSIPVLAFSEENEMAAAKKIPKKLVTHDDVRVDNYFWMNERDTKPVLTYLKTENERTKKAMKSTEALQKKLVKEMRARIKEDDSSYPVPHDGYFYSTKFKKGGEYPIFVRRKGSMRGKEEILVDGNKLGKGKSYFQFAVVDESKDQNVLCYGIDTVGRRFYDLYFKDLKTGKVLKDKIKNTTGNMVWANDNKTIFFVQQHPETLRAYRLYRYEVGSKTEPTLVYEEKDETYSIGVEKSKTDNWIFLSSHARDSSETRFVSADTPKADFQVFYPRQGDIEYDLEDGGDKFYILTNWKAPNRRVMVADLKPTDKDKWKEIIPHDAKVYYENLDIYKTNIVVEERFNGLSRIRVINRADMRPRLLEFPDPAYVVELASLPDYDSPVFRFTYQSLNQPLTLFEENFETKTRETLKVREVPTFDAKKYESRRLFATAADGTKVPLSVLVKKGTKLDGKNPCLLEAYGSYGYSMDPEFHRNVFSLVDRGFVYAIAHIRGGSEMGRYWYEEGRLQKKKNTFTDFIAAAEFLEKEKYTSHEHLYIWGGSAGGLLMGAVTNMRPDLFHGVVAAVPFVDVLTTMLDETLPLTTAEYREWGDPRKKADYMYMKSYSPYDNVEAKAYPNLFVTTGYHDSQVQYFEPAKWVAKIRELKTDKNLLLMHTEMSAGHSGASGRFASLKTTAMEYAFYLYLEGIKK
jgi:oligopeptidase B